MPIQEQEKEPPIHPGGAKWYDCLACAHFLIDGCRPNGCRTGTYNLRDPETSLHREAGVHALTAASRSRPDWAWFRRRLSWLETLSIQTSSPFPEAIGSTVPKRGGRAKESVGFAVGNRFQKEDQVRKYKASV